MNGGVADGDSARDDRALVAPIRASARRRVRLLVAAVVVGSVSAMVSASVMMIVVWLVLSDRSASTKGVVVLAGTAVGAAAGGWFSQPLVARLLATLPGDRGHR
ncbi:hypothetical protein [Micromonospora sp. WMMD1082]|uniref:hypothetical protein n=1 Tax=Micromonospora sp. WMMD1082 TaxID=3016104 RepID=UPI002415F517|nr:hypothetical protein [Micromonospora sp. WMMD1082]MDG4795114.1 hypothetical protein [Micromonospora sp. WMMD1082]